MRGALTNGVTKDEIKEILLQVAVYAGIPAGMDSFRVANEVFKEMGEVTPSQMSSPALRSRRRSCGSRGLLSSLKIAELFGK